MLDTNPWSVVSSRHVYKENGTIFKLKSQGYRQGGGGGLREIAGIVDLEPEFKHDLLMWGGKSLKARKPGKLP